MSLDRHTELAYIKAQLDRCSELLIQYYGTTKVPFSDKKDPLYIKGQFDLLTDLYERLSGKSPI
jgi:hypothetical protein